MSNPFESPAGGTAVFDESELVVQAGAGFEPHEEYVAYPGLFVGIEPVPANVERGFDPQFKWLIVLDADKGKGQDGADRVTWAFTSRKISPHPKSKGGKYYTELTGKPVVKGQPVDLRELNNAGRNGGIPVTVMFEHEKDDAGNVVKEKVFAVKKRAA